jgi:hypothetical protein
VGSEMCIRDSALTGAYMFRFPHGKFGLDKSDTKTTGEDNG